MHIWRKRAGARWLHARNENLTQRFGGSLAIIERPGKPRALLEISCKTKRQARELVREFGGSFKKLRPHWLEHFARQSRHKPLRIGSRLVILSAPGKSAGARSLIIPAAAAFGTGEHATTAMCLRLLEYITRQFSPGWTMLDAGTGSGILALAGKRLGAGTVIGLDNDPLAISTAKRNARTNKIRGVQFLTGDVVNQTFFGPLEIITANLFSELLIEALPRWKPLLAQNGRMILSGVLRLQESQLLLALRRHRLPALKIRRRGKWIAVDAGNAPKLPSPTLKRASIFLHPRG